MYQAWQVCDLLRACTFQGKSIYVSGLVIGVLYRVLALQGKCNPYMICRVCVPLVVNYIYTRPGNRCFVLCARLTR